MYLKVGLVFNILHLIPISAQRSSLDIIKENGFIGEEHSIVTSDGYILTLHRIPPSCEESKKRHFPVIVTHGILQSSADFLINVPTNGSLGFVLANNCYDVWLGNHRGNNYSSQHTHHEYNSNDYWNFSFHEMGVHDVPAIIDFVVNHTHSQQVHYVSFSMGTTALLVALSEQTKYNNKVVSAIALAPSIFQAKFYNGAVYHVRFGSKPVEVFLNTFGHVPLLSFGIARWLSEWLPTFCNPKVDVLGICITFMRLVFGNDDGLVIKQQLPLITSVAPVPTSLKTINHYYQIMGSKERAFLNYDYGSDNNHKLYGSGRPPSYNLSKVTVPIAVFGGLKDKLAHPEDLKYLVSQLPNSLGYYEVPYKSFCHLDFTYGREISFNVYNEVVRIMNTHDGL